jgi:hypothetical protein
MRWLVLLHVVLAFWLVAGFVGRNLTMARARSTHDLHVLVALSELAGRFERLMVIPGSAAVLVAGLLTAFAQDRSFTGSGNWWLLLSLILFLALIPLVPFVFLPRGRVFERALTEAKQRGEVTAELSAALRDPVVAAARITELAVMAVIVMLMVVKPF